MKRVLLIDDETVVLDLLRTLIRVEKREYEVLTAKDAASALEIFRKTPADLAVIDLRLPGMNGIDLLIALREIKPGLPAILMSAYSDESLVARARSGVALAFLPKPFKDMDEVLALIDKGLQEKK
jgi:DNA-binding NtrC family response regulator